MPSDPPRPPPPLIREVLLWRMWVGVNQALHALLAEGQGVGAQREAARRVLVQHGNAAQGVADALLAVHRGAIEQDLRLVRETTAPVAEAPVDAPPVAGKAPTSAPPPVPTPEVPPVAPTQPGGPEAPVVPIGSRRGARRRRAPA